MSKSIFCVGKKSGNETVVTVNDKATKNKPSKRINIVSIKMIREGSILYDTRRISTPSDAVNLGRLFLEDSDREKLILCCMDTKNQPVSLSIVSIGSLNSSIVHPREVFKTAILSNAASIILFHNHPSGDSSPSKEDMSITKRIKEAGLLMGIDLIDHIIIGYKNNFCSLKEKGLL